MVAKSSEKEKCALIATVSPFSTSYILDVV